MSLDVSLINPNCYYIGDEGNELYSANITHNLTTMAEKAGLYKALWRPFYYNSYVLEYMDAKEIEGNEVLEDTVESLAEVRARDIIKPIEKGLKKLKAKPEYFEQFNSPNGWGMYEHFVPFVENYLEALKEFPNAYVRVWR